MQFQDIPGHAGIIHQFKKMVEKDKVPHAILLLGPKGTAKLPMALALANYVQCTDRKDDVCGKCSACNKSLKLIHPDIHFAYPVVKKENRKREETTSKDFLIEFREFVQTQAFAEIKQWISHISSTTTTANINTRECNEMVQKLGMQSFEGSYKIQIIWMAEYLAKDSNRLLKLIEEPTDDTIIILIAENQDRILPTILSRCQIYKLNRFSDDEMMAYLQSLELSPSLNKNEIIQLANGDLERALLLCQKNTREYSDQLLGWLRSSYTGHPEPIFSFVNDMARSTKEEQKMFFEYGIHFFREYLIYLYTDDIKKMNVSDKEKNTAVQMRKAIDEDKAQNLSQLFGESIQLIDRNINGKILFSANSFQMHKIMRGRI